ncbi:MAG TPA: hypothetical protein VFV95_21805 [Vicinamibacterales bacterium]|nr:hypothetical protein [Vicinamibacterales bacterium]
MYAWNHLRRLTQLGVVVSALLSATHVAASDQEDVASTELKPGSAIPLTELKLGSATATTEQHEGHQTPQGSHEGHGGDTGIAATREGSGTSWLPDESPMYALHVRSRDWTLMLHGRAYLQYLHESSDRGSEQTGSINWLMVAADRPAGAGHLTLRGMFSAEPWTIRDCGYPDLLATGERCDDEAIHDRQHPHDLFMELAARYDRPLGRGVHLQLYGGPVGEPALGPVAFVHRVSALSNPLAPITHHWFDSTHITYGVATAGLYGKRWKAEASAFNGREPDEDRTDVDLAAMDSWSGRLWYLPDARWAFQLSAGRLAEAEAGHDGEPPIDVDRVTASATYHRTGAGGTVWATTIGWGRNAERDGEATMAWLVESAVAIREHHTWFGRVEWSEKSGHDLAVASDAIFDVSKLQGGYTYDFASWKGLTPGVGVSASASIVPRDLEAIYGDRLTPGFAIFLTLRPASAQTASP